jgi:hypothetical protein
MSSSLQVPAGWANLTPEAREAREAAVGALLALQGIAASPAEVRSASRAWQRLNPQGPAQPLAKAPS